MTAGASAATLPAGAGRAAAWAFVLLVLAGVTAVGRVAMQAWLERPVPAGLPRIGGSATGARPLLVVVIDGLRAESLWDEPTAMPWLRAFAGEGAGGIAQAGNPTLTAACVRTLLTGQWPDLLAGLRNFNARPVEGSWVEFLRERGARPAHAGDAAIAQLCALHLPPEDVLAFPDRGPVDQGECDALAVPFVLERIAQGRDLVTLHVTAPDHAGHKHGASGEPYRQACAGVDAALERVVTAFRARHPSATVLIAADHGVSPHGTHGGGEPSARRAPFVLVGPGVARGLQVTVPQAALAPTLCALLGLPQPPLAQSPPAVTLLALPRVEVLRALDAHVQARAWVARAVGSTRVDPIERKRAQLALAKMGPEGAAALASLSNELEGLARPPAAWLMLGVLLLAVLGLAALLVHEPRAEDRPADRALAGAGAVLFLAALAPLASAPLLGSTLVTVALGVFALRALTRAPRRPISTLLALAPVLALPPLLTALNALRDAEERQAPLTYLAPVAALGLLALAAFFGRGRLAAAAAHVRTSFAARPAALVALVGALFGVLLALKPFLDPFAPLALVVALLALTGLALGLRTPAPMSGAPTPYALLRTRRLRAAIFATAALLFLAPRLVVWRSASWVQLLALRSPGWAAAALLLAGLVLVLLPRPWRARAARPGLSLAGVAFVLAWVGRALIEDTAALPSSLCFALAFGPQLLVLAAWFLAGRGAAPSGSATAIRVLAALALARRLTASDAELAAFTLFAAGAVLAARLPIASGRLALAKLAVLLLLLRTAVFHAMGGVESFSTVDVGAGFVGLEWGVGTPAAGGGGVTLAVVIASLQLALRFALPWVVLFSVLVHAALEAASLRSVVCHLTLSFAARASALLLCLWAFDVNAWWVEQAYTVYALGAADMVLLLAAGLAVRAWGCSRLKRASDPTIIQACSA